MRNHVERLYCASPRDLSRRNEFEARLSFRTAVNPTRGVLVDSRRRLQTFAIDFEVTRDFLAFLAGHRLPSCLRLVQSALSYLRPKTQRHCLACFSVRSSRSL